MPKRVSYVVYVDDANDVRGYLDFRRFSATLESFSEKRTTDFSLEFVKVVVGGPQPIDAKLRELVATEPAAIVATSHDVLEAAKTATESIPILFMSYADPVRAGHVRSIPAPGVKRTGVTFHAPVLQKAVELLIDGYPASRRVGVVLDALAAAQPTIVAELEEARAGLGVHIEIFIAGSKDELADILRGKRAATIDAWFIPVGAALWYDKDEVITMMASTSKPVLYDRTSFVRDGGLMSYEARIQDPFRIWASQLLLILNGVDAATIPIERPRRFELALNLDAIGANDRLRPRKELIRRANVLFPPQ